MSTVTLLKPKISQNELPLVTGAIPAGFPSPCTEYLQDTLDINDYVIKNPASTFFARVDGDSMIDAGILPEDILVVDRCVEAKHGSVIIAVINGELTVKRLSTTNGVRLVADNPNYSDIKITGEIDFSIWGVVTFRLGAV